MKLPTIRDFYREALEECLEESIDALGFPERPSKKQRREMLDEAIAKWDSMMEAYREWEPKNVYQQDDSNDEL